MAAESADRVPVGREGAGLQVGEHVVEAAGDLDRVCAVVGEFLDREPDQFGGRQGWDHDPDGPVPAGQVGAGWATLHHLAEDTVEFVDHLRCGGRVVDARRQARSPMSMSCRNPKLRS